MSDVPATVDDATESLQTGYEYLRANYELPALAVVVAFMLWVRLQAIGNFVRGGQVYFAGNDAYYHLREVSYVVRHWPFTMPFDPWTYFPYGTSQGQFGTLFDQLVATAALVLGLGSPSERLVAEVLLVAPAVFGTLVAIPTYFVAKRLAGRRAGVVAAVLLALIPGTFLHRSLVGFADHNIAEVLFQAAAVLAFMVAVSVAEREQPVYELLVDRDWAALRTPVGYSLAAGFVLFLYVWLWPPAVVLVGILGVFYVLAISLHVLRRRSPEPLAVSGAVSMGALTVLQLLVIDTVGFATTAVSLLQVFASAAVAAACVFLAWLAREWDARDQDPRYFPGSVAFAAAVGLGAVAVLLPSLWRTLVHNFMRTFAFGQTDTTRTIAEAQSVPFGSLGEFLFGQYGLLFWIALVGLLGLAYPVATSRRYEPQRLLVVVWAVAVGLMAFTQVRFHYYLAVVVAVLAAWLVDWFLDWVRLPSTPEDLELYQVLAVAAALVLVVGPLVPPLSSGSAVAVGERNGPGAVVTWTEGLDWMAANTPAEGRYGGADGELAYYGTYERTDDFAYPGGAYGVMSWWDYGHWITVEGERVPTANPFQQGARPASAFLLAENETRAELILEALPSADDRRAIPRMSNDELRATIDAQTPQQAAEDTRYVVIDDQMAAGKFSAIATWTGPRPQAYFSQQQFRIGDERAPLPGPNDRYHGTMLARLYFGDASGLEHYRLVHEVNDTSTVVSVARRTQRGWTSDLNNDGRPGDYVNRRLSLPVFQAVQQRGDLAFYDIRQASPVKTYERVPGATLTGQVNTTNATTVWARVQMQTDAGRNFTYAQTVETDARGNFEMTVPYATTDTVGPAEGGTDAAVEATGEYELFAGGPPPFSTARGNASVPEPAVYGGETIEVTFEPVERPDGNETNGTGGNATNSSALGAPLDPGPPASLDAPGGSGPAFDGRRALAAEPRLARDA